LRVVLEVEPSRSSEAAARWLGELCSRGPCEVVLAHVYSPPDESYRLGLRGDLEHPGPEVLDAFRRECSARFARLFGSATLAYRVEPHAGRAGEALVLLAARERADVVVAGYHEGSVLARIWKGSIARSVLESSHSSAVCVPAPTEPSTLPAAKVRSVLVATDFSSAGDGAIPLAYSVVANGGTVHLVHVLISNELFAPADIFSPVGHGSSAEAAVARDRLLELAPHDRRGSAATTCIHVLQSSQPATAIRQAAERLAVDVICLGTRGRTRLAKIALGSVAEDVLANSRRPVLLARGPKD
jgi:nucleotide-binding universal stress UspA family protein